MKMLLAIIVILATQVGQVFLIVANQETNPLLFIAMLDLLMVACLFGIAESNK